MRTFLLFEEFCKKRIVYTKNKIVSLKIQKHAFWIFLYAEKNFCLVRKITKFVENRENAEKRVFRVIHTKSTKKGGKINDLQKFSTLSTQKHMFYVEKWDEKMNKRFG